MSYIDGMIVPVPTGSRDAYAHKARQLSELFIEAGALRVLESWGDDVPEGQATDMRRAVTLQPGETVVFSWILWPSKAVRDTAWGKLMSDPRMAMEDMVFDPRRMINGGFDVLHDSEEAAAGRAP
jgi:uncharacterized protein YbaA (DUF1428 family)